MFEANPDQLSSAQVAKRIAKFRALRKLTQRHLAIELGYTSGNISHVESGKVSLSLMHLKKLATLLGIHPLELIAGLPPEACRLADHVSGLPAERRPIAVRLFGSAVEMADAAKHW